LHENVGGKRHLSIFFAHKGLKYNLKLGDCKGEKLKTQRLITKIFMALALTFIIPEMVFVPPEPQ